MTANVTAPVTAAAPGWAAHLIPSLTDIAFAAPIIFILRFGGLSFLLGDGDTGWHIRTGEWILKNHRVPTTDLFSYTRPDAPWFAWEWLWDVLFGWLHSSFGLVAVLLASTFLLSFTFALVYRLASRACGNPVIAMAVTLNCAFVSSVHWLARPHLVSFLFAALFLAVLERARQGHYRSLWLLPVLTVVWANLHGGFFVGWVLVGAYAAGELPDLAFRNLKRYSLALIACVAASVVNPYAYHLHAHIYTYFTESFHVAAIEEFQSLSFHHPAGPILALLLMLGTAAAFWHLLRKRYAWVLLLVGWSWLALFAARNIPFYAIVAAGPISAALVEMVNSLAVSQTALWLASRARSIQRFGGEIALIEAPWRLHLASIALMAFVTAICFAPAPPAAFRAQYNPKQFPSGAIQTVLAAAPTARVFTGDTWGGYLIYHFYPRMRVFVDGRSDFYGPRFRKDCIRIWNAGRDWENQLNKFHVDTVLLPENAPLTGALRESHNWRAVYDDGTATVFQASVVSPIQDSAAVCAAVVRRDRAITTTATSLTNYTPSKTRIN